MLKKIQAIYLSEILLFPELAHFRQDKKGMLIIGKVLIMSGPSTFYFRWKLRDKLSLWEV